MHGDNSPEVGPVDSNGEIAAFLAGDIANLDPTAGVEALQMWSRSANVTSRRMAAAMLCFLLDTRSEDREVVAAVAILEADDDDSVRLLAQSWRRIKSQK